MPKFKYRHEAKIITWEVTEFDVEAVSQQEADQIASTMIGYDIDEKDNVTLGNTTYECNGNQLIPVDQNGGRPTVEIYRNAPEKLLATNKF